ncbi:MAG TPA: small multi-drug export protein [Clostridia bacterium]
MISFFVLLITLLVAALPVIELKGAIPLGLGLAAHYSLDINPWVYFVFAFIGSCLPAPFIIAYLRPVLAFLGKTKLFKGLSDWVNKRISKKASELNQKADKKADDYVQNLEDNNDIQKKSEAKKRRLDWLKYTALFLFVAIPLPLTGIWTGSGIASFMGLKVKAALPIVVLGNLVAGLIVMALSLAGFQIAGISLINFG